MEFGERPRKIVDRAEQKMLDGPGRSLDRRGCQRRLTPGREDHAVDTGRLGTAQQGADVLRILERVEDQRERRLTALGRPGKDVVERRELPWLDDQGNPLVAVKPCQGGQ